MLIFLNREGWIITILGVAATLTALILLFLEIKLASTITFIGWSLYVPVLFNVLIPMFIVFFSLIGIFYTPWLALISLPMANVVINGIIMSGTPIIKIAVNYSAYFLVGSGLAVYIIGLYYLLSHTSKENSILKRGLYAKVRHPQYLGIMIWTLGFSILGWRIINYLVWVVLCYSYMLLIENEESDLIKLYGSEYGEYFNRVPSILPYPISLFSKPFGFKTNRKLRILSYTIFFIILFSVIYLILIPNTSLLR
jgi:protein-S-isoprenylcysteine O-methyltransferase Ste14